MEKLVFAFRHEARYERISRQVKPEEFERVAKEDEVLRSGFPVFFEPDLLEIISALNAANPTTREIILKQIRLHPNLEEKILPRLETKVKGWASAIPRTRTGSKGVIVGGAKSNALASSVKSTPPNSPQWIRKDKPGTPINIPGRVRAGSSASVSVSQLRSPPMSPPLSPPMSPPMSPPPQRQGDAVAWQKASIETVATRVERSGSFLSKPAPQPGGSEVDVLSKMLGDTQVTLSFPFVSKQNDEIEEEGNEEGEEEYSSMVIHKLPKKKTNNKDKGEEEGSDSENDIYSTMRALDPLDDEGGFGSVLMSNLETDEASAQFKAAVASNTRELEPWEENLLALANGEWGEGMSDEAFRRWKKDRKVCPFMEIRHDSAS